MADHADAASSARRAAASPIPTMSSTPPPLTTPPSSSSPPRDAPAAGRGTALVAGAALTLSAVAHTFLLTTVLADATAQSGDGVINWTDPTALAAVLVGVPALVLAIRRLTRPAWRRGKIKWTYACAAGAAITAGTVAYAAAMALVHPSVVLSLLMLMTLESAHYAPRARQHDGGLDKDDHWPTYRAALLHHATRARSWVHLALLLAVLVFLAVAWPTSATLPSALATLATTGVTSLWLGADTTTILHGRDPADSHETSSSTSSFIQHPVLLAALVTALLSATLGIPPTLLRQSALPLLVGATLVSTFSAATITATRRHVRPAVLVALAIACIASATANPPRAAVEGEVTGLATAGLVLGTALVLVAGLATVVRAAATASSQARHDIDMDGAAEVLVSGKMPTGTRAGTSMPRATTALALLLASVLLLAGTATHVHDTDSRRGGTNDAPVLAPPAVTTIPMPVPQGPVRGLDPCADTRFDRREPVAAQGTTALVTGGSGFIGSHLVERLLSLGYKVRILDNLATGYLHNIAHLVTHANVEFVYGDIMDQDTILQAVQGVDYVYHLAAMSKVAPSMKDPAMARFCLDTNVGGTVNVLNASRIAGVKKVVYAASSTYYGNGKVPMNEVDPPNLLTPYSATKYEGEIQMDLYDRIFNLPTIAVRFFMVYGPRQPTTGAYAIVTGVFLKKWMDHQPLPIEGDGSHYRDFIHARDITKALILAQQSPHRAMVVNAGTGVGHSVHEVADLVSPDHKHVDERRNDLVGTLADTCKAKKVLGFEADYEFTHEMAGLIHDAADPAAYLAKPEVQNMVNAHLAHPWLLPPGLVAVKYEPHVADLAALAQMQVSADANQGVTVIPFTRATRSLVENAVYSLVTYGGTRALIIAVLDDDDNGLRLCRQMNLPCYDASRSRQSPMAITHALLAAGISVHWMDADVSIVRRVWPALTAWLDSTGTDLAAAAAPDGSPAQSHYVVRPTDATKAYFARGKWDAAKCASRDTCSTITRSGNTPMAVFASLPTPCGSAGGAKRVDAAAAADVCAPYVLAAAAPCSADADGKRAVLDKEVGVWHMREVCAGDGFVDCAGVPATLARTMSGASAPVKKAAARPAARRSEGRECLGSEAVLVAAA
ncbi:hypothetical protein AMAG_02622 [Allomyces macrogynus ATCC 38327]|uniref:NAD-dependent epimerase/dehydratase domain-containing protein n=1 Tax=Allomyces macrogynus (strain ATCC 38327) TaxID=578462 RepID=A0A0L0S385_ALLM3|nr:hypothetical protein AMAG_02622 [Allomyces macrogynus ATCC 38327]|eukprot:KNE56849.1 hypothetical protein AMAG_02622 [Allomyces macrogynus ATCC 38327]